MKRREVSPVGATPAAFPEPEGTASFADLEALPVDVPAWPIHQVCWFQPDLSPSIPGWSGLAVERRYRIPVPDFLYFAAIPPDRSAALAGAGDPLSPHAGPALPASRLTPLGWDPRAFCRKEAHK